MDRAYTVAEVAALRDVIENKFLYGAYRGGEGVSRSYGASEKETHVEERVRTHMLAGHTAKDLRDSEQSIAPRWPLIVTHGTDETPVSPSR